MKSVRVGFTELVTIMERPSNVSECAKRLSQGRVIQVQRRASTKP